MPLCVFFFFFFAGHICVITVVAGGQQHGVNKCNFSCNKMIQKISVSRLVGYQRNRESCNDGAVILKTVKGKSLCADPKEKWVQDVMKQLDHKAAVTQKSGTFERQIGEGEPRTTLGAGEMYWSAASEVNFTGESSGLGAESALGTSPGVAGSMGTRSSSTSKAPDGGTQKTELFNKAAVTTATSWQSSAADQPGAGLWTEGRASEAVSTQAPSTQTFSTQTLPTAAPSTQTLPTQDSSKNSLGSKETSRSSAHTDAFLGLATVSSVFNITLSSEGSPSMDALASGSWAPKTEELPKAKEPILTTAGPRSLGILMTSIPDSQVATRRQAVGLLAFLGLLFCLGVAMFAYQRLQSCPRKTVGDVVEGICYVPRSCGSNSYVLVPV
uniref:C-X3-C motif chemokine ligand 1 n=1 Tax=Moschus moschiferus TaxID=68415 RepID=A0A8C6FF65_MOSMO